MKGTGIVVIADVEVSESKTAKHQQKGTTVETFVPMCTKMLCESRVQAAKRKIWTRGWTKISSASKSRQSLVILRFTVGQSLLLQSQC